MKKHPILYLILSIVVLIIPTTTYLCFLIPKLSEEYNVLMSSAGIIGGAGIYGASKIPDTIKFSSMYKLASNAFSLMAVTVLVEKFIIQLVGLTAVFVLSFIAYKILLEVYRNGKRRKQNEELAREISRSSAKTIE